MLQNKTAEKATKTIAEKAGQKVGEFADEKRFKTNTKITAREKKNKKTVVTRRKKEACKNFAKPNTKKIRRSCEIKSNFGR